MDEVELRLPHERPAALHTISRFKSAKLNCVAVVNSLSSDSSPLSDNSPSSDSPPPSCAFTKRPKPTSNHVIEDLQTKYPTSGLCDHNGGELSSKHGDLKVTIPMGAIRVGDLVTLSLESDLFGPFVLPSNCPADVVSPYYRIRVTGPYDFQEPVQVEFEHFGACDPSHYELLCCEDDDESYTMRPADGYTLKFTIRDDISLCTFYTDKFCSYCLLHGHTDPKINRIAALYLKTEDFQKLNHFTAEIWFSFPISLCLKRNKKLYTNQDTCMILDRKSSYIFEAPCDKSSTTYFALSYRQDINGWDVKHSRSTEIDTKEINFYNYYTDRKELKASEQNGLFPHRFIVDVTKKSDCNTDLDTAIMITLCNKKEILKSLSCNLFVQVIPNTTKDRTTSLTAFAPSDQPCDHESLLAQEVQMWELTEIVVPNVMAKWDNLAYCMRYKYREVEAFKKDSQDLKECCVKLFGDWLETDNGPIPKTYQTLLNCIKKIKDLEAASKEIEKELIEVLRKAK